MKLRSIELVLPDPLAAAVFLADIWGLANAESRQESVYLRGAGGFPYLVAPHAGDTEHVRSTTFVCDREELVGLAGRVAAVGGRRAVASDDPAAAPAWSRASEGEYFVSRGCFGGRADRRARLPVKLTQSCSFANASDRSRRRGGPGVPRVGSDQRLVLRTCNRSHHSTAFAGGFSSLKPYRFRMSRRGRGDARQSGAPRSWHGAILGPGPMVLRNVFAYFIAPSARWSNFRLRRADPEDYRVGAPEDWTWPRAASTSGAVGQGSAGWRAAEQRFRFRRDWDASPLGAL